jgi:hypothetical protein
MKMKNYLSILLFATLAFRLPAADAPPSGLTVAVYDFTGEAAAASYGRKATSLVTADLTGETNLILVERAELTKALNEQAFGISGLVNSDAAAKIGQVTGAKVLVSGQVVKMNDNHLVIVADIVGTETGRLFAAKVEGGTDQILDLTEQLSGKIAQTIRDQKTNLIASAQETREDYLARIIKSAIGTNRPMVSVDILEPRSGKHPCYTINSELSSVLLKAGFTIVDDNSDRKPDVQITGVNTANETLQQVTQPSVTVHPSSVDGSQEDQPGALFSVRDSLDFKVQERHTGDILLVDHLTASASSGARTGAAVAADINVADALAEKILPLLGK